MPTEPSICRVCSAYCAILVDVEEGQPVRVVGDRADPAYRGFTCAKGRQLPSQHADPKRLLHSLKRSSGGELEPVPAEQATDEIAASIAAIVERYGPRAVAIYVGTHAGIHPTSSLFGVGWLLALGSRMVFTAATIDQPGKNIANALHGRWLGGPYLFDEADTWLFVGTNPIISFGGGLSPADPARRLREASRRGAKLIAIDPRRTEAARFCDLHLQPRPGEDPTLLAAMIRVIILEQLFDRTFVEEHSQGFAALAEAVEPFDPELAAQRAGVAAEEIVRAARTFAAGTRGAAVAGTGPNMAGRGNLTEYLLLCLTTLCGFWRRAGEAIPNPGVLLPPAAPKAQALAPRGAWGYGEKLRVRGLGNTAGGLPTAALADEILLEGEGQIRALVCIGGNPALAWPDQKKALAALHELELCVTLDVEMSATSRLADYVIASKLPLEVPGYSLPVEAYEQSYLGIGYVEPYARYTPAVVEPPAGSDVVEEWEFFYGLAQRMGLELRLYPIRAEVGALRDRRAAINLDMERKPDTDELFELLSRGSRVPLSEVRQHTRGGLFPCDPVEVAPGDADCDARLELGEGTMLAELGEVAAELRDRTLEDERYPFRLVSRRLPNVYNSSGRGLPAQRKRRYNPAFLHPDDLEVLGVRPGDLVEITSDHASVRAIADAAPELRRGVISMAHCFGDLPDRDSPFETGTNTGILVSVDRDYDRYTGIPRMSAIPVSVERIG